jgi:hypothetical protein
MQIVEIIYVFGPQVHQIQPASILFSFANITPVPLPPLVRVVKMLPAGSIMYQGECGRIVAIAYLHIRAYLHVKA